MLVEELDHLRLVQEQDQRLMQELVYRPQEVLL
jgi:hypothetical protein